MYIRRSDYPILRDTRTLRKAYLLRAVPPLSDSCALYDLAVLCSIVFYIVGSVGIVL